MNAQAMMMMLQQLMQYAVQMMGKGNFGNFVAPFIQGEQEQQDSLYKT